MHERQFQMLRRGLELLPSIQKLEKLLGHNLNITESIVEARVRETVERQIQEFSLQVFRLVVDKVDWNKLVLDAAYRRPPFEIGDKEKGFRDALVAETFLQIVSESPTTPKICRVVLVTGDKLLGEAAKTRTIDYTNVRILASHEELKGLINTLATEVGEEFVAKIQDQAMKYFFMRGDETTLYYRENIAERIREKFSSKLVSLPKGADRRENGTWYISSSPRFVRKDGQRVYWISRISVEGKAYKYVTAPVIAASRISLNTEGLVLSNDQYTGGGVVIGQTTIQASQPTIQLSSPSIRSSQRDLFNQQYALSPGLVTLPTTPERESLIASGKTVFEVAWSVSVSTNQKFSAPKIEDIKFVETLWE